MRRALAASVSLLLLTGCATAGRRAPEAPKVSALDGVLSLMGRTSVAQACPVAPDKALTAAHVMLRDFDPVRGAIVAPYIWESLGQVGLLGSPGTTVWDRFRDLAYVVPDGNTFPRWYPIAHDVPQPGDKVRFRGLDLRRRRDAFAPREFESTVIRVTTGHIVFYPPGVHGTSGSCVLIWCAQHARSEVVGINARGDEMEDKAIVGSAVGVWGNLLDLGKEEESR